MHTLGQQISFVGFKPEFSATEKFGFTSTISFVKKCATLWGGGRDNPSISSTFYVRILRKNVDEIDTMSPNGTLGYEIG